MKKKLNLFCICILVALALSTSMVVSMFYQMLVSGFNAGYESAMNGTPIEIPNYQLALTFPSDMLVETGSVTNLKDSCELPVKPIMSLIAVPASEETGLIYTLGGICAWVIMIAAVYALVYFFKLIRHINRGIIFDWANVKLLRRLGWSLIMTFAGYFGSTASANYGLAQQVSLNGCDFSTAVLFSDPTLVLGFVSLLVAEIFAIGLKMKEEQDLTI